MQGDGEVGKQRMRRLREGRVKGGILTLGECDGGVCSSFDYG